MDLKEKIAATSPQENLGNTCNDFTSGKADIDLPEYMWLVETNSNVAAICLSEDKCTTTFTGPLGLAASFNRTVWRQKGDVIGTELRAFNNLGVPRGTGPTDYIGLTGYGPNINIARDPRFGRTSELPGEDPYLNGHYAKEMVLGMQTEDKNGHPKMLAYLKHYTAYSTEDNRGHANYNITMYDFFDTYLKQYEIAFTQSSPAGAMCSYNAENGFPSCANDFILNQVVRGLWNQTMSHITTDCGAVENLMGEPANAPSAAHASAWSINNGTDLEMGSSIWANNMFSAVTQGLVKESTIETSFKRAFSHLFKAGRFDPSESIEWSKYSANEINSDSHKKIQEEAALQSLVLLKNNGVLPLAKGANIAVVGPMAVSGAGLLDDYHGDHICYGGNTDCVLTIAQGINNSNIGGKTMSAKGVDINSADISGIAQALNIASSSDIVVLALGDDSSIETEGEDRTDTALPGLQESFAKQILALGKPTILIFVNGGAIAFDNLIESSSAIIEAYNPSLPGATAIAKTLFGESNRWGKLVTTLYSHDFIKEIDMTDYRVSTGVGRTYRYYTGKPLYPFGFGLSYSEFQLQCDCAQKLFIKRSMSFSDNNILSFSCHITNIGKMDGDEVLLVYHSVDDSIRSKVDHPVPLKHLVQFDRATAAVGQTVNLSFQLDSSSFLLVNSKGEKVLYPGKHYITFSRGHGVEQTCEVDI